MVLSSSKLPPSLNILIQVQEESLIKINRLLLSVDRLDTRTGTIYYDMEIWMDPWMNMSRMEILQTQNPAIENVCPVNHSG